MAANASTDTRVDRRPGRLRAWALALGLCLAAGPAHANQRFDSLCYHDVRDDVVGDLDNDQFAVSTDTLVKHFDWLKGNGYRPVSVDDLLAARAGEKPLPEKAILLTFDDGYASFYTRVYPLLEAYGFPAVLAVVGRWLEHPAGAMVQYGREQVPRERFLTWAQIREMKASGLVEIASHSYDMHRGVLGNPQGNRQPAAVTRRWFPDAERYESQAEYLKRVRGDLERNSALIARHTGSRPRVMVWPYGKYSGVTVDIARDVGMPVTLTLDDGLAHAGSLSRVSRWLIEANPTLSELVMALGRHDDPPEPMRVAHVDLDYLHDPDPAQQARNFDRLLDRIKALRISHVFLQAFADPDGDGNASALYFPNRHLPVRADLFNRVAWQLRTRAEVNVYAWMPVLAFDLPGRDGELSVRSVRSGEAPAYRRLSPFVPEARRIIREIYEDLVVHAHVDGLLFHDDAYLDDFEDARPEALAVYRERWGLDGDLDAIRADPAAFQRWSRLKTRWLVDFTLELAEQARRYRPGVRTARNLYPRVVLEPESEAWFAQALAPFTASYDFTALMAMPFMEGASDPLEWLDRLVDGVEAVPGALPRTVFELQSRDWRAGRAVPTDLMVEQMRLLERRGAASFGYYPDDFIGDHPAFSGIRPAVSLEDYPYSP